jgi:hypothetical protein
MFCSISCYKTAENVGSEIRSCAQCEKERRVDFWSIRTYKGKNFYCNRACMDSFRDAHRPKWICQICSKEFIGRKGKIIMKYCSNACRVSSYRKNTPFGKCKECGKEFFGRAGRPILYCSRVCSTKSSRGKNRKKQIGYYFGSDGYLVKSKKSQHRAVAEELLGRSLKPSETIHHINEIRSDNRPENLYLFATSSEHTIYHRAVKRGDRKPIIQSNLHLLAARK